MENKVIETIINRRSIKKYIKDKQIEDDKLEKILKAGSYAANGMGMQSPLIIAVQDKDDIDTLRKMNVEIMGTPDRDPFYGAPTVVIVLADKARNTGTEDGSLVIGNMMLAAEALGIGSCWIHRAREEFESDKGKALLKKWGINGNYIGVGHCILGYADGDKPTAKPRKADYIKIIK